MNKVRSSREDARSGKLSTDYFPSFICAGIHDPSRAPLGKAKLHLYHMVPMIPEGGLEAWEAMKAQSVKWLFEGARACFEHRTADNVRGKYHEPPQEFWGCLLSFGNGDVSYLESFAEQFLGSPHTSEFSQYRLPGVERSNVSSPLMHPYGGVTGGGQAVAMHAMQDFGMVLDKAFPFH